MNYDRIKKIIGKFSKHCKAMYETGKQIEARLIIERERLNSEYFGRYKADLYNQLNSQYRAQHDSLCKEFSAELDSLRDELQNEVKKSRPADYELKLANAMSMIDTLDERTISNNLTSLQESIKPFSYDPIAKATLSTKLSNKGVMAFEMFDETTPFMLDKIETAREFTKRYNDPSLPLDMALYFDRNFEGFEGDDVIANTGFSADEYNFYFDNMRNLSE